MGRRKKIDKASKRGHSICLDESAELLFRKMKDEHIRLGLPIYGWFSKLVSNALIRCYGHDSKESVPASGSARSQT